MRPPTCAWAGRLLRALPLYHVYAFISCRPLGMRTGGLNVLIPKPRDIAATVEELGKLKFNVLPGVNTLCNAFLNNPSFAKLDFSELLIANGGSIAVQEAVAKRSGRSGRRSAADRPSSPSRDMEEESGPACRITAALPIDAVPAACVERPTVVWHGRRKLTRHVLSPHSLMHRRRAFDWTMRQHLLPKSP
jgi:acyl-CoA synthetase (AMP-forming)/AMP-acid ligase II